MCPTFPCHSDFWAKKSGEHTNLAKLAFSPEFSLTSFLNTPETLKFTLHGSTQVFFTLLNFFLAIIVDAFVEVKEGCGQLRCTQSFFRDLTSMVWTLYLQRRYKLPPPKRLATLASKFDDIDIIHIIHISKLRAE